MKPEATRKVAAVWGAISEVFHATQTQLPPGYPPKSAPLRQGCYREKGTGPRGRRCRGG